MPSARPAAKVSRGHFLRGNSLFCSSMRRKPCGWKSSLVIEGDLVTHGFGRRLRAIGATHRGAIQGISVIYRDKS
jgi:hypothetical protein